MKRNDEDRLISIRKDFWTEGIISRSDSVNYNYDSNKLLIEIIDLGLKETGWKVWGKHTYSYDDHKNNISRLHQYWTGTEWINNYNYMYNYDSSNKFKIVSTKQDWEENAWLNTDRFLYEVNSCGKNTAIVSQDWKETNWLNHSRTEGIFGSDNLLSSKTIKFWNETDTIWRNSYRFLYEKNQDGQLLKNSRENWDGNNLEWKHQHDFIYSYDESGNLTSYLWIRNFTGTWDNVKRELYRYDQNDNLILYVEQSWNGATWENKYRELNSFNLHNNIISQEVEEWNDSLHVWDKQYRINLKYNTNDNINELLYQIPNESNWINDRRFIYYYAANEITANSDLIKVFPNPNDGCFTVKFDKSNKNKKQIYVFDITGKFLYHRSFSKGYTKADISLHDLPNGTYFLKSFNG